MKKSILNSLTALMLIGAAPVAGLAGQFLDNFQDNNFASESWTAGWVGGSGGSGKSLAYRTRQAFPVGASDKDSALVLISGNYYYQYGTDPESAAGNSQIAASDRTTATPAQRLHFAGLNLARGTAYDATAHKYLRFTAWLPVTQPTWASTNAADTFVVGFGELNPSPNSGVGPWNSTGTTLVGVPLTSTPTAYLVEVNDSLKFKIDPIFTAIFGGATTTRASINSVNFGYRRSGAPAAASNLGRMFFIDDIAFLNADPGYTLTPSGAPIDESGPGNTTTFTVVLNAQTTNPITISPVSAAPGQVTVSPASWTFIPTGTPGANESLWNSAATFTLTAVDDFADEANTPYNITFTSTVNDLAYTSVPLPTTSITVQDDDLPPGYTFTPASNNLNETSPGNTANLSMALDGIPSAAVDVTFAPSNGAQIGVSPTTWRFLPSGIPGAGESLWNSPASITVTATDDGVDEADITYTVTANVTTADLAYTALANPAVNVQVLDDDLPAAYSFTPASNTINESPAGNSVNLSLALASAPTSAIDVTFVPSNGAQISVSPTTWRFLASGIPGAGESLWSTPAAVTVTAVGDGVDEPDTTYTVTADATTADAAFTLLADPVANVEVLDDDVVASVGEWTILED